MLWLYLITYSTDMTTMQHLKFISGNIYSGGRYIDIVIRTLFYISQNNN